MVVAGMRKQSLFGFALLLIMLGVQLMLLTEMLHEPFGAYLRGALTGFGLALVLTD